MNAEKEKAQWEKTKYFGDKIAALVANPVMLLVGGFAATNILQHTKYAEVEVMEDTTVTADENRWIKLVFPQWGIFFPPKTVVYRAGTKIPMTVLTDDQANLARTALLAYAGASGLSGVMDILKGNK